MRWVRWLIASVLLAAITIVGVFIVREDSRAKVSEQDRLAIGRVINALGDTIGTRIVKIEWTNGNSIRVETHADAGDGGDIITFEKHNGEWRLVQRGVWIH